jgi:monothiol glutaredoxin
MSLSTIPSLINQSPVVLFIKGSPEHPQCGFSRMVVRILNHLKVPFASFDVLQDMDLRENLKIFSNWPTFPQLYVNGELIGGCDIAQEMFTTGELAQLLEPYVLDQEMGSVA